MRLRTILCLLLYHTSILGWGFQFSDETFLDNNSRYIGIEDGLSHNSVTSIFQDNLGYIWIGTFDGLNRYNGYDIINYRHNPSDSTSLLNNRIESIYGYKNKILIGTKKGLNEYNYITNKFSKPKLKNSSTSNHNYIDYPVNEIKGHDAKIYVGSAGDGLMVKDYSLNPDGPYRKIPLMRGDGDHWKFHAQAIEFSESGQVWVFVQGVGLTILNQKTQRLEIKFSEVKSAHSLKINDKDELWLGLDNGVLKYHIRSGIAKYYTEEELKFEIKDILFDQKRHNLLIATDGNGLMHYDRTNDKFLPVTRNNRNPEFLYSKSVYALFQDDQNRIWIGSRGGICLTSNEVLPFITISKKTTPQLNSNFILSFAEKDSQNFWVGTDGDGFGLFNRKNNSYSRIKNKNNSSLNSDFISGLLVHNEKLWVATYGGGLSRYDPITDEMESFRLYNDSTSSYQDNVWLLFKDSKDTIWAASSSEEGLFYYDKNVNKFQYVYSGINGIISIEESKSGEFWIGTFNGLYEFSKMDGIKNWYQINFPVRSIVCNSQRHLLLGTEGGGLFSINPEKKSKRQITIEDGLPNNSILNILKDSLGNLWMSTFKGITKLNSRTNKFQNFYSSDGLQSNQFNYNAALKLNSGHLLFGGIKGFNIIDPRTGIKMPEDPNLIITDIKINNTSISGIGFSPYFNSTLELPYDKSMISVEYVALEYDNPNKIEYKYILEGWDEEWHKVGGVRMANYSKLPEGEYLLKINSTNAIGDWGSETIKLPIKIFPPWYRSNLAYISYIFLLCIVIYLIVSYQRGKSRLKYEIKLSKEIARKDKELSEKKLNFFTNISHEFRSPLTLIINPLKDIIYGETKEIDPNALEIVYHNSRRLLRLVDQLMSFRKVDSDTGNFQFQKLDIVHLTKEVFACYVNQAKSKHIDFELHTSLDSSIIYYDQQKIEIAIYNLIANALKFAPANNGRVVVFLRDDEHSIYLEIKDNGSGIEAEDNDKVFDLFYQSKKNHLNKRKGFGVGLYLAKKIIDRHNGSLNYKTNEWGGATFIIRLLKGVSHLQKSLIIFEDENQYVNDKSIRNGLNDKIKHKKDKPKFIPDKQIVNDKSIILVIDDNPQIRNYIESVLEEMFTIKTAESAEKGLELLKRYNFDFIISDVVMDNMSGVELCKILKEDKRYQHIPVILLTAGTSEDLKLTGIEVGAEDYITKPFDRKYLIARIQGILSRRSSIKEYYLNQITGGDIHLNKDQKISEEDRIFLEGVTEVVEENFNNQNFHVKNIAHEIGMSQSLIYKKIKFLTNKSVSEFIRFLRLKRVATLLITSDIQINQAATSAGFGDIKYFRSQFKAQYKMTPTAFRKKYKNIQDKRYFLNMDLLNKPDKEG